MLIRHRHGKASRSGEIKLGKFWNHFAERSRRENCKSYEYLERYVENFPSDDQEWSNKISIRGHSGERNSYKMYSRNLGSGTKMSCSFSIRKNLSLRSPHGTSLPDLLASMKRRSKNFWIIRNQLTKRITIHNVASLAGDAYPSILTLPFAINGFECCCLWPFECEIFLPETSVASKLTDEPKNQGQHASPY